MEHTWGSLIRANCSIWAFSMVIKARVSDSIEMEFSLGNRTPRMASSKAGNGCTSKMAPLLKNLSTWTTGSSPLKKWKLPKNEWSKLNNSLLREMPAWNMRIGFNSSDYGCQSVWIFPLILWCPICYSKNAWLNQNSRQIEGKSKEDMKGYSTRNRMS